VLRIDSAIWRAKLFQATTVSPRSETFWRLRRTRRGIVGAAVLAVLLATLAPLGGCNSEKGASRPPDPPTPAPTLEGGKTKLGDILVNSATQGWGTPQLNRNVAGRPFSIAGQKYQTGFGTVSVSRIEISFPGKYSTFAGSCGIDDEVQQLGTVVFKILDRGKVLFASPLMKGKMKALDFSVPVNGLTGLTLIVEDGGDGIDSDHADWVNLNLK
jgi:NPCBM/NEW2 domain